MGVAFAGVTAMDGFVAFLVLLGLVGAARIAELILARRFTRRAAERGAAPQREPMFLLMVVLHVLPFLLCPLEVKLLMRPFTPTLFWGSAAALAVLFVFRVWTLATLGARWNVRIVQPDAVVVAGPYRYVRHPNYAIVIGELFFLPLAHGCWITLVVLGALNAFVLFHRIRAEEEVLFALPGYAEQMGGKKRFVPGVF